MSSTGPGFDQIQRIPDLEVEALQNVGGQAHGRLVVPVFDRQGDGQLGLLGGGGHEVSAGGSAGEPMPTSPMAQEFAAVCQKVTITDFIVSFRPWEGTLGYALKVPVLGEVAFKSGSECTIAASTLRAIATFCLA